MAVEKFNLKLIRSQDLAPSVKSFVFVREDGKALDFIPGQFVTFMFPSTEGIKRRSYSIANAPGPLELEIAISYVEGGFASQLLFNASLGDAFPAMGPVGKLILQEEPIKRVFLVGTGTGIAPYRAMLPTLSKKLQDPAFQLIILEGVQYRQNLLYGDDFVAFTQQHANAQFFAHYSRENLTDAKPHERKGYVQNYLEALTFSPETDVIYLCGNPNMIDQTFEMLEAKGIPSKNIRREKYISSN